MKTDKAAAAHSARLPFVLSGSGGRFRKSFSFPLKLHCAQRLALCSPL